MENVTKKSGVIPCPITVGEWVDLKDGGREYRGHVTHNTLYYYKYEYNFKGDIFVFGSIENDGSIESMTEKVTGMVTVQEMELKNKPGGQAKLVAAFIEEFHKKHKRIGYTPIGRLREKGLAKNNTFLPAYLTLII